MFLNLGSFEYAGKKFQLSLFKAYYFLLGATKPVAAVQNPVPARLRGSCHPDRGHRGCSARDGRHQGQGQDRRARGQDRERDTAGGDQGRAEAYRGGAEGPGEVGTAGKGGERETGQDCQGKEYIKELSSMSFSLVIKK